jgi:Fic family protein
MVERAEPIREDALFHLHKAVQTEVVVDIYKPIGAWKKESNGTYMVNGERQVFYEYADPAHVPDLMAKWLVFLNSRLVDNESREDAVEAYAKSHLAFVWIHPFYDGNGRMARLLANIPVLKAGFPPIVIPKEKRKEYIGLLSKYELEEGCPTSETVIVPDNEHLRKFVEFCRKSWRDSINLVDEAHGKQKERDARKGL